MKKRALSGKKRRELIQEALADTKGQDITVLDVRKVSDYADYLVIASGTSNRHVSAMADKVVEKMAEHGVKPVGREGQRTGDWVLVDYGDIVVHLMRQQIRDFYGLEKLWSEGREVKVASNE